MILSTQGIVFHTLKYSETSVIAKVYTRELGLLSFLIPGVRSKSGKIRASHLMPLNLLDLVISYRQQSGLQKVRELRCQPVLAQLHANITRTSIAMFMKEMLHHAIREEEKNEALYDFIAGSIQVLDLTDESLANFPVHFLVQLSKPLGFYPDLASYKEGYCFDLEEGQFIPANKAHAYTAEPEVSRIIHALCNGNYGQVASMKMIGATRKSILQDLLQYYRIHVHDFKELKSPAILGEILSAQS